MVKDDGSGGTSVQQPEQRSKETVEESWDMAAELAVLVSHRQYPLTDDVAKVPMTENLCLSYPQEISGQILIYRFLPC